jgi:hypothetical protein
VPENPESQEAQGRRAELVTQLTGLFPGADVIPGRTETTVELPFSAGKVTVRSTTAGTEDVSWTMSCWPPATALRTLADAAQDAEGRLLYLDKVAAARDAGLDREAGG